MKLSLLSLAALSLSSVAFGADGIPTPYPEQGLFGPIGATPSLIPSDVAPASKGHPAWDTKISIESKGLSLRAVLATAFESAKVPYAVDPSLNDAIYASVKDVTLRDAFAILNRLTEFEVRGENGVWYASRRKPKTKTVGTAPAEETSGPNGESASKTILVDVTPRPNANVPMRVTPPASLLVQKLPTQNLPVSKLSVSKTTVAKKVTAKPGPVKSDGPTTAKTGTAKPASRTAKSTSPKPAYGRRVTTKLPKADLRHVFETFSQQTGVPITVDESVPRYKIDSYMKGCSLKYALDRICEATGLKYESHGTAIRIFKAS